MSVHTDDYAFDPSADPGGGAGSALGGFTLPGVFKAAVAAGADAVALTYGRRSLTWRQWEAEADALARGLQELGVGAGDVVAVHLPNSVEFQTLHIAVATVGAVMMPIHQGNGSKDVHALLARVEPAVVVLPHGSTQGRGGQGGEGPGNAETGDEEPGRQEPGHEEPLSGRALLRTVPSLRAVVVAGPAGEEPAPGVVSLDSLRDTWAGSAPHPVEVRPDMPFVLVPSSGTTSARPKICVHSHDGLLSNTASVTADAAEAFSEAVITACPLTHLFGLQSMHSALFAACRQVLLDGWDPDRFLELARQARPSVVFAVPTQLHDVVARLAGTGEPAGFRPVEVRTAGAAVPGALVEDVRAALDCSLVVVWGMSELGTGTCTRAEDPADVAVRSVGRPTSGARVRIVDQQGSQCPPGEAGELQYRSPGMFRGYFGDPELTRAALTEDGWLRTGDLASVDEDGLVMFHGRTAELINVGGRKFNATEIQGLLAELPGIGPLAVLGTPDPRLGEYPCLVLTDRADPAIGLTDVTEFLQSRGVADYKIPLDLVTVGELPLTPAGKLHRRALQKMLATAAVPPARPAGTPAWAAAPRTVEEALDLVAAGVAKVLGKNAEDAARATGAAGAAGAEVTAATAGVVEAADAGGTAGAAEATDAGSTAGAAEAADAAATTATTATASGIAREVTFRSLGLDSILTIRLRNALQEVTGIPLPATLAFDFPTPIAVARFLAGRSAGGDGESEGAGGRADDFGHPLAPGTGDVPEPVAIVGMACRLPGGAVSPERLWDLVSNETDAISAFPDDRGWDLEALYHPDPEHRGTSYAREGGFLHDAGHFDAGFFDMSDREALATDPQQRLLLETAWEAFEQARIDPGTLKGTRTGVFTGAMYHDYAAGTTGGAEELEGLLGIGTAASALSGRIAYAYGFEGPALTVDTACSSSLVALHLACQSLRSGESALALAGGVAVMATPSSFVEFSRLRGLSPDGRCKSFADGADGAAWSEGVGLLLLERLSDAQRNGHRVLAVVRGSAVNQDGASNGLTAPNGPAQRRVVRQALARAGLSAQDVDAVEGHGTGTTLGDPIEAQALLATYGRARPEDGQPLWLGSVKSNIGHAQAAAGVAGVIKTVLSMQHGVLPKTLHVRTPSSHVDWSAGAVRLLTEARPWPRQSGRTRRAGVSSFGISGTNAHVILEEPPEDPAPEEPPAEQPQAGRETGVAVPWLLSARSDSALRAQARRLAGHLEANPRVSTRDIAFSLATTRALHGHRAVVTGDDRAAMVSAAAALGRGETPGAVVEEQGGGIDGHGRAAFVFTGQGSQRLGMGRELAGAFPVFDAALREVCAALDPLLGRSLTSVMWAEPGPEAAALLDDTGWAQPALFAVEVALYRLFASWGAAPDHLVGHSVGEIAAAHVAGVLSLPDACALVVARSRLMRALPPGGAMTAVRIAEDEVAPWLAGLTESVSVAAVNGPRSVVLSGACAPLAELTDKLVAAGYKAKQLVVSHAFHSPLMDPMLADFRTAISTLTFTEPSVPLVSGLTGRPLTVAEAADPEYWVRHVRETVRFKDAIDHLRDGRTTVFVELGPAPALTPMIDECLGSAGRRPTAAVVPTVRAEHGEVRDVLTAITRLYGHGVPVAWTAVLPGAVAVPLPTYAFAHRRYWLMPATASASASAVIGTAVIGTAVSAMGGPDAWSEYGYGDGDGNGKKPSLSVRLSGLGDLEQEEVLLAMVLSEVTAVLGGHAPQGDEAADQSFADMGINSVNAIELRNRLIAGTGIQLPSTLVFDYPTPTAIVRLVREALGEGEGFGGEVSGRSDANRHRDMAGLVDELEGLLSAGATVDAASAARLKAIAAQYAPALTATSAGIDIDAATDEELFRLMDGGGS
ncbi:beta-ketoacyl synthase N-terminal-like domain-containing protein [Streptomyces sp. NPDC026206]|uniref:type I polyketide synthase n=1 Tax=Streptomyces sp. NPDC026206 TaxID=3157089 RepID=UPI0033D8B996